MSWGLRWLLCHTWTSRSQDGCSAMRIVEDTRAHLSPVLFAQAGWLSCTLMIFVCCILSAFSCTMICDAAQRIPGNRNFDGYDPFTGKRYSLGTGPIVLTFLCVCVFCCWRKNKNIENSCRYEFCDIINHYFGENWARVSRVSEGEFSINAGGCIDLFVHACRFSSTLAFRSEHLCSCGEPPTLAMWRPADILTCFSVQASNIAAMVICAQIIGTFLPVHKFVMPMQSVFVYPRLLWFVSCCHLHAIVVSISTTCVSAHFVILLLLFIIA